MRDLARVRVIFDTEYFYQLRKEKNLTLKKLASLTSYSYPTLSRISLGGVQNPGAEIVCKLAWILGVSSDDLMKEVKV